MWVILAGLIPLAALLILLCYVIIRRSKHDKARRKQEMALQGIAAGICERLHAASPGAKWRWVCRPAGFARNGGIARIEVAEPCGKLYFIDCCLAANGYMGLHVSNAVELAAKPMPIKKEAPVPATTPVISKKPNDEESLAKWCNIVLTDPLTALIGDLNAKGEVCLHIGKDGKAYVEDNGGTTTVHDFGDLPDMSLWGHIIDKLSEEGLFAEVNDDDCIFVSWA
jgi:hypothetical protein